MAPSPALDGFNTTWGPRGVFFVSARSRLTNSYLTNSYDQSYPSTNHVQSCRRYEQADTSKLDLVSLTAAAERTITNVCACEGF